MWSCETSLVPRLCSPAFCWALCKEIVLCILQMTKAGVDQGLGMRLLRYYQSYFNVKNSLLQRVLMRHWSESIHYD